MTSPARTGPDRLLDGLDDAQRVAVEATTGLLAIVAGAGSGKTRVISHRAAYAIETGAVLADRVLLVTFTDRAAGEMVARMSRLGHPRVMARTFHSAAYRQLGHFWPDRHAGAPLPQLLESKAPILGPLVAKLPGHYRFAAVKDLAEAIEWAKVRRIRPERWIADGGDRAPIPPDLFARVFAEYERSKRRADRLDYEDLLVETVELLESDEDAARLVRARKTWFSVDEYQDTNPLAERLLELWLGGSDDLAVVGDPEQTIYSFTGATSAFLLDFATRHPGARTVSLLENYRSTPQVIALANRLTAGGSRGPLRAIGEPGPVPAIGRFADEAAERDAIVAEIRRLLDLGVESDRIALLVRINAQLPDYERALTAAGIGFRVRGRRFFERREVREARRRLRLERSPEPGPGLVAAMRALFEVRMGLGAEIGGDEARDRAASLEVLIAIAHDLVANDPELTLEAYLAALDERDAAEAAGSATGVELLTYHRAKGLEWDAVLLPALEEGLMPVRQAKDDTAIAEERRLLYVGITRARRHLALSWTAQRAGMSGREARRTRSRFLDDLSPPAADRPTAVRRLPPAGGPQPPGTEGSVLEALRSWRRERARSDGVPAYVIAPDETLVAIAMDRPRSLAALGRVRGMGPTRLERFGSELLAIVDASP